MALRLGRVRRYTAESRRRRSNRTAIRAKLLWRDDTDDVCFCKQVGLAIGERVDGVREGPLPQKVAWALRPASVSPTQVSVSGQSATVRVPKHEVARAIGRRGSNVSLASRLLGIRIKVIDGESHVHG